MGLSASGRIRSEVIDKMTDAERRELIAKAEEALDAGHTLDTDDLTEHVGEILIARGGDEEDEVEW